VGKQVTVLSGYTGVALPSALGVQLYDAGAVVTLTDAEYAALPASTTRSLSTASNVAEPNRAPTQDPDANVPNVVNAAATGSVSAAPGYNAFTQTGIITLVLAGFTAGLYSEALVEINRGPSLVAVNFPAGVRWAGGSAPTPTATINKIDIFRFASRDGGTTVLGTVVGQNL
jgi:hypothetical protein